MDYDNYGISGVEKYLDKDLKDKRLLNVPLQLTLDTNIQHIINNELKGALKTFKATGGGAILMNSRNGEILSLVSLPNFNINQRKDIQDKNFINKITKGVYELGSIFKTFTVALALEKISFLLKQSLKIFLGKLNVRFTKYLILRSSQKIYQLRIYLLDPRTSVH